MRAAITLLGGVVAAAAVTFAGPPGSQEGGTWTVNYGDPGHSGEHTTIVMVEWTDELGKSQDATFTGTITIDDPGGTGAVAKKQAAQTALQNDVDDNEVDGEPLIELSGGGDVLTVSPNTEHSTASNIEVEEVDTEDDETNNDDEKDPPEASSEAHVGMVEAVGSITGTVGGGGTAVFSVVTNEGLDSIVLDGSMTKAELLDEIGRRLAARGATVWVDDRREVVLVLIDDDPIERLGAGTNDSGLVARSRVRAPE